MTDAARKRVQEAWIQEDNFKVRHDHYRYLRLLLLLPSFNTSTHEHFSLDCLRDDRFRYGH